MPPDVQGTLPLANRLPFQTQVTACGDTCSVRPSALVPPGQATVLDSAGRHYCLLDRGNLAPMSEHPGNTVGLHMKAVKAVDQNNTGHPCTLQELAREREGMSE